MNEVLNKFIDRLTDNYDKSPNSNVYKLMQLATSILQEQENTLTKIGNWRDVDQAEGTTLDMLGANVRQYRGAASDEAYRILIKSKIKRNLSNGSINTLIDFLSFILQIPREQVKIRELWDAGQHATIKVEFPMDSLSATGLTGTQFGVLVNNVTAAGIKAEVLFSGTFSFSEDYNNPTISAEGFQGTGYEGGTLGDSFDPADQIPLPI
ncbi:I-like baseplate protein [Bacillus phage vB_BcM_Sam46]|uniref:I-like baseplate protein n=1 Tax=Bacillus phage vB_BcM_Sam46 TaxID=2719179 RepID=A0A6G9L9C1_9CAUD|nr:I-like baseplate protein [Bacillus phage vB_BcM_Sam46]